MQLRPDYGTYIPGLVTLEGSFRADSTNDPDDVRDGNTNIIDSVVRESTGLFTVTFDVGFPLPEKLVFETASHQPAIAATVPLEVKIVADSYSQADRSFQIQVKKATNADTTTLTVADPADDDRIGFYLRGSIVGIGTD